MRVLVDMNLSPDWVEYFHANGVDSMHWSVIGPVGASDHDIMQWAQDNGCVVLTADLDFAALLAATGARGPSVIQIRAELLTTDALGPSVLELLLRLEEELKSGAIVTLDAARSPVRVLPLS